MKKPCLSQQRDIRFKAKCKTMSNGDIVVTFPEQVEETPQIFINVDDMMNIDASSSKRSVQKIILPNGSYRGGKYGEYGGYDISLIKVSQSMPPSLAACLPGPRYTPSYPMIGGYGRYRRVPCETTDMGPQVE